MRTPLAHVLEDAVAAVAAETSHTTRRRFLKTAGGAGLARPRSAGSTGRPRRRRAEIVVSAPASPG